MDGAIAELYAGQLEDRPEVEDVEIDRNHRGTYLRCTATDRVALETLYDVVEEFPVWVDLSVAE